MLFVNLVVGKSNILLKWTKNKFKTDHEITIGVEFGAKNIKIDETNKVFRIQVWDTVIFLYYSRQVRKHSGLSQELIIKTLHVLFLCMTLQIKSLFGILRAGMRSANLKVLKQS